VTLTSGSIFGAGKLTAASYGLSGGTVAANLGAGTLTVTGNTILTGTSEATAVNINAGTLQIGNGGTAGGLVGTAPVNVASGAALVFNHSNDLTYGGTAAGAGGLTKSGTGTLTLSGVNTFSGQLDVQQGVLSIGSINNVAASGPLGNADAALPVILGSSGNTGTLRYTGATATSTKVFTLATGGTGAFEVTTGATNLTLSGVIDGSGALTKTGAGTLTLAGTNTYSGATSVNAGTLNLNFSAAGAPTSNIISSSSGMVLGGGTLNLTGSNASTTNSQAVNGTTFNPGLSAITFAATPNPLSLNLGAITRNAGSVLRITQPTGTLSASNGVLTSSGSAGQILLSNGVAFATIGNSDWAGMDATNTFIAPVTYTAATATSLSGNASVDNASPWATTLSSDTTITSLRKTAGTHNTTVTINAGITLTTGGILVTPSVVDRFLTINGSGSLRGPAGQDLVFLNYPGWEGHASTISVPIVDNVSATGFTYSGNSAPMTLTGSNTYTGTTTILAGNLSIGAGGTTGSLHPSSQIVNNGSLTINRSDNLTFSNSISGTGTLTKSGAGTMLLSGTNTYSGNTTVSAGTLTIDGSGVLGGGSYTGNISIASTSLGNLTYNSSANQTFSGVISGAGAINKSNSGTLLLTGTNTYTGVTTVTGGTLLATQAAALSGYNVASKIVFNGGTVAARVGGAGWTTTQVDTLLTGATKTSGALGIDTTNGSLTQWTAFTTTNLGSSLGLAKLGSNTLILDQTNTYTGATTINQGILAVSSTGSINNSSAVTINGGNFRNNSATNYTGALTFTSGTISGTNWGGSLSNLTIGTGQIISPGNSPGTAVTGDQTWAAGGSYTWEINSTLGTAGADPGWDLINGSGTLSVTALAELGFSINVTSLTTGNASGAVSDFDQSLSYNWLIADFAAVSGFSSDKFTVNTSSFSNAFTGNFGVALGNSGTIGGDNTQVWLTYTAIPEPKAALLGGLGLLLLLRRRREK
jgi:autotransporter-associated beta strand protein